MGGLTSRNFRRNSFRPHRTEISSAMWTSCPTVTEQTNTATPTLSRVDIVPNRNGADQYGNTHSISVYDKQNRKPIYLGNLKPQEFGGQGGNGGGHSNGSDDLPW